jgi:cytoskeletal protein RodZ
MERIRRDSPMTAGEVSKETIGDYLKRERESRRVSLEEISQNTRISRPYLEALERNDFRFFSRPEYIQGFLRGYARYISLDPSEVLKRYEVQLEIARLQGNFHQLPLFHGPEAVNEVDLENPVQLSSSPARREKFPISRSIFIQVIILAAALTLSFYLYRTLKRVDQEANPPGTESVLVKEARKGADTKRGMETPKGVPEKAKGSEKGDQGEMDPASSLSDSGPIKTQEGKNSGRTPAGNKKGKIYGNPETKMYSLPGMKNYEKMKTGKRVEFNSEEEAIKKGYRKGPH